MCGGAPFVHTGCNSPSGDRGCAQSLGYKVLTTMLPKVAQRPGGAKMHNQRALRTCRVGPFAGILCSYLSGFVQAGVWGGSERHS